MKTQIATLLLMSSGCAAHSMRPPQAEVASNAIPVIERDASQRSLQIGATEVRDVWRMSIAAPGTTPFARAVEPDRRDYHFKLQAGGHALHGECREQYRDAPYFGLGKRTVDLRCECSEAKTVRAALLVREGRGEAVLPDHAHYEVWEAHESAAGKRTSAILGYRFRSARGEGGIDTTQQARAYMPRDLSDTAQLPLTCLYAALLLHDPGR